MADRTRPIILVTNDDGITAPGIRNLVEAVKPLGEVIVVAPDSPQSAKGHAITISEPIRLHKVEVFEGIESYECSGTPVDCVKLAKQVILHDRKPDLCVSGINHGSNAGINILYSGTMSAAMEASLEGVDSVGFSLLDYSFDADFTASAHFARLIAQDVLANGLPDCKLLNVNIPNLPLDQIKGIRICHQADAQWEEEFHEATDPRGVRYFWLTGDFNNTDTHPRADINALEAGYISVVPSGHDLTLYPAIEGLAGRFEQR